MKPIKKKLIILCSAILVVALAAGITVAYLSRKSNSISNNFTDGTIKMEIQENVESGVKRNVKVKNTGDFPIYARAQIVVTWQDADGNIYSTAPVAGTDYTSDINTSDWFLKGNTYYCKKAVTANETSKILINSIAPIDGKAPAGYNLSVEVLASGIQAAPDSAVESTWGVTVDTSGCLTAE